MQVCCASTFYLWSFSLYIEFYIWIQFDIKREGKAEDFPDERRIWIKSFCSKGKQWLLTLTRAEFKVDADRPNFPVHWSLLKAVRFITCCCFSKDGFPTTNGFLRRYFPPVLLYFEFSKACLTENDSQSLWKCYSDFWCQLKLSHRRHEEDQDSPQMI